MTGTRVEIELVTSNQEMKVNRPLAEVFYQAMEQTNLPEYTEEELRFAESLTKEVWKLQPYEAYMIELLQ